MIFNLKLSTYNGLIYVLKEDENVPTDDSLILLSKRDPDQPLEHRLDSLYFNALIKKNELCSVNSENVFTNIYTGKSLPKIKDDQARGWFMLPPVALTRHDIHPDVMRLIGRSPKLTGVIAQVARATMGLRIPDELNCSSKDAWLAWITAQKQPVTPAARQAFSLMRQGATHLHMTEETRIYMQTGQEPEPTYDVRIRWCEFRTFSSIKRRLYESPEWSLRLNSEVLKGGKPEILKAAYQEFGEGWRQVSDYPTGETITDKEQEGAQVTIPLIYVKNGQSWELINESSIPAVKSINDLFSEAIKVTNT